MTSNRKKQSKEEAGLDYIKAHPGPPTQYII